MKRLYLVRHGRAEDYDHERHTSDVDRALTTEGRDEMEFVAKRMRKLDEKIEVVLSSPLRRARETAEILAKGLRVEMEIFADLTPPVSPARLLKSVRARKEDRIVLVGHEPGVGDCLGRWISELSLSVPFRKGGVARIDVPLSSSDGPGVLVWLATPEVMGA